MMKIRYKYFRFPEYKYLSNYYSTTGKPDTNKLLQYHRRKRNKSHWGKGYWRHFRPTTKGGAVYCIVELEYAKIITVAYCSMSDTFSYDIGKQIAYNRAMRHLSLVEGAE